MTDRIKDYLGELDAEVSREMQQMGLDVDDDAQDDGIDPDNLDELDEEAMSSTTPLNPAGRGERNLIGTPADPDAHELDAEDPDVDFDKQMSDYLFENADADGGEDVTYGSLLRLQERCRLEGYPAHLTEHDVSRALNEAAINERAGDDE